MKTILVIDDESDIIDIVADQIDLLGLELRVLKATTVEEAESQMGLCDMIISDVKMPNREKLEALLNTSKKPVARITGHDDFRGDLVIRKPFEVTGFRLVIEQLLQRSSQGTT